MTVRAKFKVTKIEATKSDSGPNAVELRSVHLAPVYGNGDPEHENSKFWKYTPTGSVVLGTINPAAWEQFELGGEYYLDFTKAD